MQVSLMLHRWKMERLTRCERPLELEALDDIVRQVERGLSKEEKDLDLRMADLRNAVETRLVDFNRFPSAGTWTWSTRTRAASCLALSSARRLAAAHGLRACGASSAARPAATSSPAPGSWQPGRRPPWRRSASRLPTAAWTWCRSLDQACRATAWRGFISLASRAGHAEQGACPEHRVPALAAPPCRPCCPCRPRAASDRRVRQRHRVAETDRPVFTAGSLRHWHGYAAKVSYRHSFDKAPSPHACTAGFGPGRPLASTSVGIAAAVTCRRRRQSSFAAFALLA